MEVLRRWGARAVCYSRYAKATFPRIGGSIRLSSKDRDGIQKRALQEGLGYQRLVSSLLHVGSTARQLLMGTTSANRMSRECRDSAVFLECAHGYAIGNWDRGNLAAVFNEGGGLKNPCRERKKNEFEQVLA